jgi:hypothetical protein
MVSVYVYLIVFLVTLTIFYLHFYQDLGLFKIKQHKFNFKRYSVCVCLTGHFINSNSKLISKVLSFIVFRERHTGE